MAQSESKTEDSADKAAEKAYADAAAEKKSAGSATKAAAAKVADTPAYKPDAEATTSTGKAPAESAAKAQKVGTAPAEARSTSTGKTAAKERRPSSAKSTAGKAKAKPAKKSAPRRATAKIAKSVKADPTTPSVTELKEKIMATKQTDYSTQMTDTMSQAVTEMQTRAQAAYEKGTASMGEMTDFAKGNVEAMVESGKILAEGMQSMSKTYADEAKTAYETATADMKEMAAIKSPTELFQLQGKILRRNFDMLVATTSKNTDAAMKLANDAMAPITGRINVATEKMSKVA
ncbi:phasin family protein [Aurantiacibacter spongiae]|uniref:Phasin family protein n=1 Tax=Aurantiacibacter spongiae TaxID=2488860 RepID=A0A3N5DJM9_9SPHN|nr:phasin family protein [Aurantiacibacter spongiae]RPF71902.1 phasin family protein [Aurantiacibacter spongiae]